MVSNHAVRGLLRPVGVDPGQLGDCADQRLEQVDRVIVMRALQNGRDALEPHAGVDRRPREIDALAALELLVLHEHEVPDLDEAVAFGIRRARRAARNLVAVVVENFGARSARTGIAHGPEIVRAGNAQDFAVGQPRDLLPKLEGVVIVDIDSDEQPLLGKREILGDERPGELDRPLLEVVAEGEVAEHLEEGVVARGIADIVEVVVLAAGTNAFLRGHGTRIGPLFQTGEHVLERHHAGIGEHQRGIVARDQRRRRNDLVVIAGEEVEKALADVVDAAHFGPCSSLLGSGLNPRPAYVFSQLFSGGVALSLGRGTAQSQRGSPPDWARPKTPSPPSSVAAALRSRVPTGANA